MIYGVVAFLPGSTALDNDTLSLVLAWKLIREGVILDQWTIATPKPLLILVDGLLWQLFGPSAVVLRSILTFGALVGFSALLVGRYWGAATGAAVAVFLAAHRELLTSTMSGNSTIAFTTCLVAALVLRRRPTAALLAIFAATLVRGEGLAYLGLALVAIPFFAPPEAKRRAAALAILLIGLAPLIDAIAPSVISGRLRSNFEVTREISEASVIRARRAAGEDYHLDHYRRLESSYAETLTLLLGRHLRPLPFYIFGILLGVWAWRRHSPSGLRLILYLGIPPLIYCWAFHLVGFAVFGRFLLPTTVAALILTVTGLVWLAQQLSRWRFASAGVALVGAVALVVVLRDARNDQRGYLTQAAQSQANFQEMLEPLAHIPLQNKRLLVSGAWWPHTHLALRTDMNRSVRTDDLIDPRTVAEMDYLIVSSDDPAANQPGFQVESSAESGRYVILGRTGR